MRAAAFWLCLGALCLAVSPAAAQARRPLPEMPDYVFVVGPEEETVDVVYFADSRPVLIRFRARIHDRGFRTAWGDFACRLFDYLDTDGNRILSAREAEGGRWSLLLTDVLNDPQPPNPETPTRIDVAPRDGKVSFDELARYLRETLGYTETGAQPGSGPDPRVQALFPQLDVDGDGALAPPELAGAEDLLRRLDADDDELVSIAELRPHDNPYAERFGGASGSTVVAPESDPIVALTSAEARAQAARRLVNRYAGKLDRSALEAFLDHPAPGLVLDVRLGRAPQPVMTLELAGPPDSPGPLASKVKKSPEEGLVLDLDGIQVRLGLNDVVRDFRRFFEMRFNDADVDKDGALDKKEAENTRFFVRLFEPADRDNDGKLTRRELTAYLDRSVDATESRLMLTTADSGRNLFGLFDTDRDGRLSRRELRSGAKRLSGLDRDGDGWITLAELPRTYELSIGRGPYSSRRGFRFESYDSPLPPRPGADPNEPSWFRNMDRNHDGDVSPREFLGTTEDFRQLDRDGDGLIDPREAAKGP